MISLTAQDSPMHVNDFKIWVLHFVLKFVLFKDCNLSCYSSVLFVAKTSL